MIGPIFQRETAVLPRRPRHFAARVVFLVMVFAIISTTWLLLAGIQPVQNAGDLARFGVLIFQLIAPFQLFVLMFLGALAGVTAVSHEKDRQTLTLLLMTSLSNAEVVLGKIGSGLLLAFNALLSVAPILFLPCLLGGVSLEQSLSAVLITASTIILTCSLGATVAFWREKTFQAIAVTLLSVGIWIVAGEAIRLGAVPGISPEVATIVSPLRALWQVAQPIASAKEDLAQQAWSLGIWDHPIKSSMTLLIAAALLMSLSILKLRVWNPNRERRRVSAEYSDQATETVDSTHEGVAQESGTARTIKSWKSRDPRPMWSNPILWREMRTWAYGKKVLIIRVTYLILAACVAFGLLQVARSSQGSFGDRGYEEQLVAPAVSILAPLMVFSLILINALAVNSVTNERDGGALDLLLVTEITSVDFIFGKILGVLYVMKEMVLIPILLLFIPWFYGGLSTENLIFSIIAMLVMDVFVCMLGIHCGMIYYQSRAAIGTSLGTVFFLFLGVATCMLIMLMFRGSFGRQLAPFLMIILGGGTGLYLAIGNRNPSPAIALTSFLLPFLTFFAITSFILRDQELTVFSTVVVSYAFATAAMLIPALSEFEFAFGRGKMQQEE
ncbi:MAG: ABC transporter permease subunit [Pirellula sp.]|jgi:ABC-type transport system involved in multi-copper enzyme maturation permease subunit